MIRISGYLMWLFVAGIIVDLFGVGESWHIQVTDEITLGLHWFGLLVFLNQSIYNFCQSMYQFVGDWCVSLMNLGQMPTPGIFTTKGQYILPFTGKWTVADGDSNKYVQHGGSVSQTYAYDFIITDDEGKSFQGNAKNLQDYYCYAQDVIAPADGVVVHVHRSSKDSFVDGKNVYCDSMDIRGNYITIKHHEYEYSVLAHLMPKSINVKVGDVVKQGDIIAKCGNSGSTSEPHLHFQLQTGKSFFLSVGLPVTFAESPPSIQGGLLPESPTSA